MSGRASRQRTNKRLRAAEWQVVPPVLFYGPAPKTAKPMEPVIRRGETSRRGSVRAWRA